MLNLMNFINDKDYGLVDLRVIIALSYKTDGSNRIKFFTQSSLSEDLKTGQSNISKSISKLLDKLVIFERDSEYYFNPDFFDFVSPNICGFSVLQDFDRRKFNIDGYSDLSSEDVKLFDFHMSLYQSRNSKEVFFVSVRRANPEEPERAVLVVRFFKDGYEGFHFVTSDGEYFF